MDTEAQDAKRKLLGSHTTSVLPDFEKSLGARIICIVALILTAGCSVACIITSAIILARRTQIVLYRSPITIHVAAAISFGINVVLTQILESTGFIHATSLRWALFREERLKFNTNLRLFTSSKKPGPNKWYINMVSAGLQVLSYAATSMIFVDNSYPGDLYSYINPVALCALGVALLGQVGISIWCLRSAASTVPTWSSNPLNTALASLHSDLQRRPGRCMLSVDQGDPGSVPAISPRSRQSCLLKATPAVGRILRFTWILAGLAAIWTITVLLVDRADISTNELNESDPWKFKFEWNVDKGPTGEDDLNDIGLGMSGGDYNAAPAASQLALGILFVFAVQGLQTTGLHCTELLVNMWRDENSWRAAYVQDRKSWVCLRKSSGSRLNSGLISSAIFSGPYMFLFLMKALLHWLLGQSISPSVYIIPISDQNLNNFQTSGSGVSGLEFLTLNFEMLYFRLLIYTIVAIVFGFFTTALALRQPTGPQPVTWGHQQTLADLIDDWTMNDDGRLWWGNKGISYEGIRHAGTSPKKSNVGEIVMTGIYKG